MIKNLPTFESVFFVHYQCDKFEDGNRIHDLHIYARLRLKVFTGDSEAQFLKEFTEYVQQLMNEGLIPVHWNQNRPHYGPDHINSRYRELTNEDLKLDYCNEINLAEYVKDLYGEDYITGNANRLNRLSELNKYHGHTEHDRTATHVLHANRTLLLSRIYKGVKEGTLITDKNLTVHKSGEKRSTKSVKKFSDYLIHPQREAFAQALSEEFCTEKSKKLRLLIQAMKNYDSPLISFCAGEGKALYSAMKEKPSIVP